jgi:purine-binding chemotaxis protein CheW
VDFLKIRKKARERAGSASPAPKPPPQGEAGAPAAPASEPVVTETDVLEGELAARLQGLPPPDERFTTWRPGTGAPPRLAPDPSPRPLAPREEDFAVVDGLRGALRPIEPAPLPPPPPPRDPLDDFFYREDEEAPPVPVFGGGVAAESEAGEGEHVEYLAFFLGREEYAVPIEHVREVLKPPAVTEVPRAPAHVLGVVTVRGEVVAVCDPRRRLDLPGAPAQGAKARLVVVDAGEGPCALLVDAVANVVRVPRDGLEPCPQGLGGGAAECLAGIGRDGNRLFTALDLVALLRRGAPARAPADEDRLAGA